MASRLAHSYYQNSREHMIQAYLPLVQKVIGKMVLYGHWLLEEEDMFSLGVIGLLQAIDKYDSAKGVPFESYATNRIRGAVLDELRKLSWRPRSLIDNMKKITAVQDKLSPAGREWDFGAIAKELGEPEHQVRSVVALFNAGVVLSFDEIMFSAETDGQTRYDLVADQGAVEPHADLVRKERQQLLAKAITKLEDRDQLILSLYYEEELTLREIGKVLGISEGRVCQVHARALIRLRQFLEE